LIEPWHPDRVIEPRFAWRVVEAIAPTSGLADAGRRLGLGERAIGLLAARGLSSADELEAFFAEPISALHDPALLPDAGIFLARMRAARAAAETVMVFGDFDADGLTGLAILVRALRRWGMDPLPYVPSRLDEGHGLSPKAIDAARAAGATLIVTVDCGSTSVPEIAAARAIGIDVIVTDHHRLPPELPVALAIVNPQRADSRYPERRLAGSGVAFKLASSCWPTSRVARPPRSTCPISRRSAASPTSFRCSARRGRSSGSASPGSRPARGPASRRCWRPHRSPRPRSTARPSPFPSHHGSTRPDAWASPPPPPRCS